MKKFDADIVWGHAHIIKYIKEKRVRIKFTEFNWTNYFIICKLSPSVRNNLHTLTNNIAEYSLPTKLSLRSHFRTDRKCHPDNEREEATLRAARRGPLGEKKKEKSFAKPGTERRRKGGGKKDSETSASPLRGLVGLASGSVYRKQMGYACSAPYFTGIYCLLFGRSRYAHGPRMI